MRLATIQISDRVVVGVVDGSSVYPLPSDWPQSMLALIQSRPSMLNRLHKRWPVLKSEVEPIPLAKAALLAPIPRPHKNIYCIGLNYREHARESATFKGMPADLPDHPVVFTKNVTAVNKPAGEIPSHANVTSKLDWEVELGVVIGIGGRGISREAALDHVFGYTVINDVSARDLQVRHQQFFLGKSLDGCCPMGPVIVTRDEIPDPQNLHLTCRVNGVMKQNGYTKDMIFDVATLIHTLSQGMTLEPGDVIATGTPAGVGFARHPPEYLKPGDTVECEIEGIGKLDNRVA